MDFSNLAPNMSNVLTPDTLKVVGALVAILAAKWAVGKAWSLTKTVARFTATSVPVVGVISAGLMTMGASGVGLGIGEVTKSGSPKVEPVVYTAKADENPDIVKLRIDRQVQDFSSLDYEQYKAKWGNLPPANELARATQNNYNPQDHVKGTTSIGLGIGMLIVGIAVFLKKYG